MILKTNMKCDNDIKRFYTCHYRVETLSLSVLPTYTQTKSGKLLLLMRVWITFLLTAISTKHGSRSRKFLCK